MAWGPERSTLLGRSLCYGGPVSLSAYFVVDSAVTAQSGHEQPTRSRRLPADKTTHEDRGRTVHTQVDSTMESARLKAEIFMHT